MSMSWKPNWRQTRQRLIDWWNHKGMVLNVDAPTDKPVEDISKPPEEPDAEKLWTDPLIRLRHLEYRLSTRYFGSDKFPFIDTQLGPGSLGTFLGARPHFVPRTVWYDPCIDDPDTFGPIRFDPQNHWFKVHMELVDQALKISRGRFTVGIPDLIENIDTLSAMRGTEQTLMDVIERPDWVHRCLGEINEAFFSAFQAFFGKVRDEEDGNCFAAFNIWAPGRTAKVQCDFSAMISPAMFNDFVLPYLDQQCRWLDYSMYHLDGTTALQHLDSLLSIEALDAIEWTPQPNFERGGHKRWYDLYKQIKRAGKSIQVLGVMLKDLKPLFDTVGPEGIYILTYADSQAEADKMIEIADSYR